MLSLNLENPEKPGRLVRWETPFCNGRWPSVYLIKEDRSGDFEQLLAIVRPSGFEEYPKYIVHFGVILAFTSMEECGAPRDFSRVECPKEEICSYEYIGSPWLGSYDGMEYFRNGPKDDKTNEPLKLRHYLIFGGDNNIEVISPNIPRIEIVTGPRTLNLKCEL